METASVSSFDTQLDYSVNIPLPETVPVSPRKNSNNQVRYENESQPPPVSDDLESSFPGWGRVC